MPSFPIHVSAEPANWLGQREYLCKCAYCSGGSDLMEGRVQNLAGLDSRHSFDYGREDFCHFRIRPAAIRLCIFSRFPQTKGLDFSAVRVQESDFVEKSLLFVQQWNDFSLKLLLEVRNFANLQVHRYFACKHDLSLNQTLADNPGWFNTF